MCVRKSDVSATRLQRVSEFKRGDIFRRCAMELPPRRFSGRGKWPTCLKGWEPDLGGNGVSCSGKLWLAAADYALDEAWMRVVGATLTWEALGMHCKHRQAICEATGNLLRELPGLVHVRWCHAEWDRNQMRASSAFERIYMA